MFGVSFYQTMSQSTRISYVIMAVLLALIGVFHLGTLVLTAFFGYFALLQLSLGKSKLLGAILYVVAVVGRSGRNRASSSV